MILLEALVIILSASVLLYLARIMVIKSPRSLRALVPATSFVSGVSAAALGMLVIGGAVAGDLMAPRAGEHLAKAEYSNNLGQARKYAALARKGTDRR